eukprot:4934947-Pleurochrysis_carterae.AAC.2
MRTPKFASTQPKLTENVTTAASLNLNLTPLVFGPKSRLFVGEPKLWQHQYAPLSLLVHATHCKAAMCMQDVYGSEHAKERQYFDHAWYRGETYPSRLTCVNVDAPTQHGFDLPCQRRVSRDVVKTLDGKHKWLSKVTGAMVSGVGFMAYVACSALGVGPNLVLTVLLLVLEKVAQTKGKLGSRLHVQLDNTCGENKDKTAIAFLAWLVYANIFQEAGFFCLMNGHTFTILDQSFGTLIKDLKTHAVCTISRMLVLIRCAAYKSN